MKRHADRKEVPESSRKGKTHIPFTPSNVMRVTRDWWGEEGGLGRCLSIPKSKLEEIRQKFSDELEQKQQLISYWINTDPLASWRRLIHKVDQLNHSQLADSIRSSTELITDASLTPPSILHAVSTVEEFWWSGRDDGRGLLEILRVPISVLLQIMESPSYSTEDDKRIAGLQYYLQTIPGASWGRIAGALWQLEEHTALETVTQYVPHKHDGSLNHSNMTVALATLPAEWWRVFGRALDVPHSKLKQIESQFTSEEEKKEEVFKIYLTQHPHPTWEHVADTVYRGCYFNPLYENILRKLQSMFPTGRNRAKKIYEEEMKRGVSKRVITKVVMVGVAGSGKSTSLETVMDEEPPAEEDRESTPLLKRPVQTEVIYVEKKVKWKKKTPEEKKRYIASILRARAQRLAQSTDPPSAPTPATPTSAQPTPGQPTASPQQQSSTAKQATTTPASAATAASPEGSPDTVPEVTVESLLQSSDEVDDEFISLINIPSDTLETILTEVCVYVVDSGGQPEFVDAMTVFLGQTSACILVIDLSQPLDHYPMIGYYRRGKAVSKPYLSTRTNEENLKTSMRTMNTFTSKAKGPPLKLLFLGTHRDKLHECDTETVEDKNKRLKKIIPSKFWKQIIWCSSEKLIFEMNALNPDDMDKKTAERIRRYIIEQCPVIEVELPLRWHTLEEKLRSFAASLGRMVMSREECWLVAESVGLDEASFDGALDFFHSVSLMFYFREILPKIVFIDPQVMLDKVSELIEFMFELREPDDQDEPSQDTPPAQNPTPDAGKPSSEMPTDASKPSSELSTEDAVLGPSSEKPSSTVTSDADLLPPNWQQFMKFGRITKEFLEDERFSSHYHTGIFTCDDVIHLLEELLVFAKQSTDDNLDTWFMPSVLRQAPAEKVCMSAGALVVDFPDGGPQNGIFCSLMSHVLSPKNCNPCPWKLRLTHDDPACLYRDCIQFQVPKYIGSVTLIDRYDYFEVHVFTSEEEMQELWQHVRNAIFSGIDSVCELLGYSCELHPAIVCPATHDPSDKAHPAYIKNDKWACTKDSCVFGYLRAVDERFHWHETSSESELATTKSTTPQATTTSPPGPAHDSSPLGTDDLFAVYSELLPVAPEWEDVGLALHLDPSLLKQIRADNSNVRGCLRGVLTEWLKKGYNSSRFGDPSWRLLVEAVAHPAGGNNHALAEQIARKYNN